MTELEHFIKQKDVETFGRVCSIARAIKTKDEDYCENHDCFGCVFSRNKDEILKILLSEHKEKPQLNDDEKSILRNIDNKFKYIARSEIGNIFVYVRKPSKIDASWFGMDGYEKFSMFNHLFQFIKWEDDEPYKIEELLKEVE